MNPGTNRTQLEESIQSCCKSLFLTSAIPELIKSEGTPKQVEYLCTALQKEVIRREENRRSRLVKRAHFPTYKTFEGYEYRCVKLPPALCKGTGRCQLHREKTQSCFIRTCWNR